MKELKRLFEKYRAEGPTFLVDQFDTSFLRQSLPETELIKMVPDYVSAEFPIVPSSQLSTFFTILAMDCTAKQKYRNAEILLRVAKSYETTKAIEEELAVVMRKRWAHEKDTQTEQRYQELEQLFHVEPKKGNEYRLYHYALWMIERDTNPERWKKADDLVSQLDCNDFVEFMFDDDDNPDSYLVWLLIRHNNLYSGSELSLSMYEYSLEELFRIVSEEYKDLPLWMSQVK